MRLQFDLLHLLIGNLQGNGIFPFVQFGFDLQAGLSRGTANQIHDHFMADPRAPSPVHADMRKEPMLNLIPFAGSGWKMTDRDLQAYFRGQFLQFPLPQSNPIPIASPAIAQINSFRARG